MSATGLSYRVTQICYVFGLQSRLSKILAKTAAALVQPTPETLSQKRRIIFSLAKKTQPTLQPLNYYQRPVCKLSLQPE